MMKFYEKKYYKYKSKYFILTTQQNIFEKFEGAYFIGHTGIDTDTVMSAYIGSKIFEGFALLPDNILTNPESNYLIGTLDITNDFSYLNISINDNMKLTYSKIGLKDAKGENIQNPKFVLLDHNESSQSCCEKTKIDGNDVIGIIDHHAITTRPNSGASPINLFIENVGSTCTILYKFFSLKDDKFKNSIIGQKVKQAIGYGIISDTLGFNSPTTTSYDKDVVLECLNLIPENVFNNDIGNGELRNILAIKLIHF